MMVLVVVVGSLAGLWLANVLPISLHTGCARARCLLLVGTSYYLTNGVSQSMVIILSEKG